MTIREMLVIVHTEKMEAPDDVQFGGAVNGADCLYLKNTAAGLGFAVTKEGHLAIAANHHEITRISGHSRGYHRQMQRHDGLVESSRYLMLAGKQRECVILGGILDFGEDE